MKCCILRQWVSPAPTESCQREATDQNDQPQVGVQKRDDGAAIRLADVVLARALATRIVPVRGPSTV